MAIAAKIIPVLLGITIGILSPAWGQGDFAPYEKPEKLKKIIKKSKDPKQKKSGGKRIARRQNSQVATVVIEGAAVYEAANFDAPVMEYLSRGKKIVISKKLYPGIGGLGAFYKVRLRKGVYGYITDVDIAVKGKKDGDDDDGAGDDAELSNDPTRISREMYDGSVPEDARVGVYLNRYVGLGYYQYNYTEKIGGSTKSASTPLMGIKYSGPTGVLGGMPLDIDFLFQTQAPSFYDDIAASTSGMMILASAAAMIPFAEFRSAMIYYGLGPMFRYSKWDVTLKSKPNAAPIDSQEIGAGIVGTLGFTWQLGAKINIRADGKYIYEKEKYFGFGGGLQIRF